MLSPDGVAPSRMVSVSASVNLPLHHKVQKFSSGTGVIFDTGARRELLYFMDRVGHQCIAGVNMGLVHGYPKMTPMFAGHVHGL